MDAITYLISRKSKSPYRISGLLLAACLVIWANVNLLDWIEQGFPQALDSGIGAFGFVLANLITHLAGMAAIIGVLVVLPLYQLTGLSATLRSWSENRILDELSSTGLSHRFLIGQLFGHYLKRWFIVALPSMIFAALLVNPFATINFDEWIVYGCLALSAFMALACHSCWSIASGKQSALFSLVPSTLLFGPFLIAVNLSDLGFTLLATVLVLTVYTVYASYILSIKAFEHRALFEELISKSRSYFSITSRKQEARSENPIVARQEMRGREIADLAAFLGLGIVLLASLRETFVSGEPLFTFAAILLAGFVAAWRAAGKLSQSLTQEMESSTLETVRSTPMGSSTFLQGWLYLTLRPLLTELALLIAIAVPFVTLSNPETLYDGSLFLVTLIAMGAPFLGALFGASIAGQCKPRSEVSGQLNATVIFCGVLGLPHALLVVETHHSNWLPVIFTLIFIWGACWALKAGACKSLNRVFLPQK